MAIYSSVAELIGNTPMLSLSRFAAAEGVGLERDRSQCEGEGARQGRK